MPRRRVFGQREVHPDPRYHDKLVGKFINVLMTRGKKSTAERVCYGAFDVIQEKTGGDPLKVFRAAVDNVKPIVEVKSRRVGGASYQVPVEIRPVRRMSLALRWITDYSKARGGKSMAEKLAAELLDASNNTGASVKKREDTHRMAEANKAFAHYRW
jgi:small subunit ribosomal protein S7